LGGGGVWLHVLCFEINIFWLNMEVRLFAVIGLTVKTVKHGCLCCLCLVGFFTLWCKICFIFLRLGMWRETNVYAAVYHIQHQGVDIAYTGLADVVSINR
jgi:hypothetical protein